MDLGFSRRKAAQSRQNRTDPALATLLATLAARQALSPTARREAEAARDCESGSVLQHKAGLFVPAQTKCRHTRMNVGSFNTHAAKLLVSEGTEK